MEIEKAIELLSDMSEGKDYAHPLDQREAIMLGIEALKRVKNNRVAPEVYQRGALPGETERRRYEPDPRD